MFSLGKTQTIEKSHMYAQEYCTQGGQLVQGAKLILTI